MEVKNMQELNMDEMEQVSGGTSSEELRELLEEALSKADPCIYCQKKISLGDGRHTIVSCDVRGWNFLCGSHYSFILGKTGRIRRC